MRRLVVVFAALCASGAAQADIKVPHFKKLKPMDVCGADTKECAPTSSQKFAKIDGLRYTSNPGNYLGRRYSNIYETAPCIADVNAAAVSVEEPKLIKGWIKSNKAQDVTTQLGIDIKALLNSAGVGLPADAKAKLGAEFEEHLKRNSNKAIDMKFYRVDLTPEFMDLHLTKCLSETPRRQKVATGISVIEVSGTWARDWYNDTFVAYETSASYRDLGMSGRAAYDALKQGMLSGSFPPASYVVRVAYRQGEKS